MARWRIVGGPSLRKNEQGIDGELWLTTLEHATNPARRHTVVIARTAKDSDPRTLPLDVRRALETRARSAVEITRTTGDRQTVSSSRQTAFTTE